MAASRVPFMAPSDCDPCHNKAATGKSRRHSSFGNLEWVTSSWSEKPAPPQVLALRQMAEPESKFSVSSITEGNCGKLRRGSSSGGPKKVAADDRQGGGGEVNPGEHWFNLETSSAERRTLFRLENEMEATLMFEHGGSRRASELWVTRILLRRCSGRDLVSTWL